MIVESNVITPLEAVTVRVPPLTVTALLKSTVLPVTLAPRVTPEGAVMETAPVVLIIPELLLVMVVPAVSVRPRLPEIPA